jgi:hypothetical protein
MRTTTKAFATATALALLLATSLAAGADCLPRKSAPGQFPNVPKVWNGTDSGPILDGFLDLSADGNPIRIVHGVDLSANNDHILYSVAKDCGADFAIVKMDKGFSAHLAQLRQAGLKVIPYSYLSVADSSGHDYKKFPVQFSAAGGTDLDQGAMDTLLAKARAMGEEKADDFTLRYENQVPDEIRTFDIAGLQGRFVVIDVEEVFAPGSSSRPREKITAVFTRRCWRVGLIKFAKTSPML